MVLSVGYNRGLAVDVSSGVYWRSSEGDGDLNLTVSCLTGLASFGGVGDCFKALFKRVVPLEGGTEAGDGREIGYVRWWTGTCSSGWLCDFGREWGCVSLSCPWPRIKS